MTKKPNQSQSSMLMFDKEDERINDICLLVDDRKFWCSKQHLSLHSEYFNSMFNGDFPESIMKVISLNDPQSSNDFHLFLLIINGLRPFDEFDDEAVTCVLALSNLWMAKVASAVCLEHLLKSERSTLKEKYFLADAYKLEDYKAELIASIKTKEELASIVSKDPISMDQATKDKLYLKSLELHGIQKAPEPAPNPPTASPSSSGTPHVRLREAQRHREMQNRRDAQRRDEDQDQRIRELEAAIRHLEQGGDPLEVREQERQRREAREMQEREEAPGIGEVQEHPELNARQAQVIRRFDQFFFPDH
ncbi:unnamed protein product [Caenorhabditis brenneri]